MNYSLTWLADVLRSAGLAVVEEDGWQSRGRAEMGQVLGVIGHHTGGPPHASGTPSLPTIIHGRPDLAGPLSQLYLAGDGTVHVVAAGKCNHAGAGRWGDITDGNAHMIGIEAENAGTGADPWPGVQMTAYARTVAAILKHLNLPAAAFCGHKEYALPKGRKVDPTFDCGAFRALILTESHGADVSPSTVSATHPHAAMLKFGDHGDDVKLLQSKLEITVDGSFGQATQDAVKLLQADRGLKPDGLVGPATWAALGV